MRFGENMKHYQMLAPENAIEKDDDIEGDGIVIPPAANEKDGEYVL